MSYARCLGRTKLGRQCANTPSSIVGDNPQYCRLHQTQLGDDIGTIKRDRQVPEKRKRVQQLAETVRRSKQEDELAEAIRQSKQDQRMREEEEELALAISISQQSTGEKDVPPQSEELTAAIKRIGQEMERKKKEQQEMERIRSTRAAIKSVRDQPPALVHRKVRSMRRDIPKASCQDLGGFINVSNSCYLDSLLYGLLHSENDYIDTHVLYANLDHLMVPLTSIPLTADTPEQVPRLFELTVHIQELLREAMNSIYTGQRLYCGDLRQAVQEYAGIYSQITGQQTERKDWVGSQLSPIDVMIQINKIFTVPELTKFQVIRQELGGEEFLPRTETRSYVIDIHQNQIADFTQTRASDKQGTFILSDLINMTQQITDVDQPYSLTWKLLSTPLLYVHLNRIAGQSTNRRTGIPIVKIGTVVFPDKIIPLNNGQYLGLVSIMVHRGTASGGHYVAYIKCDQDWYFYNDIKFTKLEKIGSFERLTETHGDDVLMNATDFIYM